MAGLLALSAALLILAPEPVVFFHHDFEAGGELTDYPDYRTSGGAKGSIVEPGAYGEGHCLLVENPEPLRYASVTLSLDVEMVRNLTLSFDVKAQTEDYSNASYVGILFFDALIDLDSRFTGTL